MLSLTQLYTQLFDHYGPQHWWPAETIFEMAVGAFLTQNTAWTNVELALNGLREAGALSPGGISALSEETLQQIIRPSGFYRQKSERLGLFVRYLQQHHQGKLENLLAQPLAQARAELLGLKGVGPETADSILLYAGQHRSFVVDAYTRRLTERLGCLQGDESYEEIRSRFMQEVPADSQIYNEYHALIVAHCKQFCRPAPRCTDCFLRCHCPTGERVS